MSNETEMNLWISVEAIADYFTLSTHTVRDEMQQRHLLGEIEGKLHATMGQAYLWAFRRFGHDQAFEMFTDLESLAVASAGDVPLVEEHDESTDVDRPYLL